MSAQCPGDPHSPLLLAGTCTSHTGPCCLQPPSPPRVHPGPWLWWRPALQLPLVATRGNAGHPVASTVSLSDPPLRASPDPAAPTGAQPRPARGTHEIRTVSCLGEVTNVGVTARGPVYPDLRPERGAQRPRRPPVGRICSGALRLLGLVGGAVSGAGGRVGGGVCACACVVCAWPGQASARGAQAQRATVRQGSPLGLSSVP